MVGGSRRALVSEVTVSKSKKKKRPHCERVKTPTGPRLMCRDAKGQLVKNPKRKR